MVQKFYQSISVLCVKMAAKLPPKIAYVLAWIIARLLVTFNINITKKIKLNLKIAFPHFNESMMKRLCNRSVHQSVFGVYEIAHVWCCSLATLNKRFLSVHGGAILRQLLDSNTPIILLCPHLGCWEMANYWLNHMDYNVSILYKPMPNEYLDQFMFQARGKGGSDIVQGNRRGIKKIYQDLKNHKMVGILPDQVPQEKSGGVMAPFFSTDAATMTLVHTLIKKTNASPIFISAIREQYKGFHIHIQCGKEIIHADLHQSLLKMNEGIEKMIAIAPEQYQWAYSRYRSNPLVDYTNIHFHVDKDDHATVKNTDYPNDS